MTEIQAGDRVECTKPPPHRASWRQYEGKHGTVVSVNRDEETGYTEYGVVFGNEPRRRPDGRGWTGSTNVTWFLPTELVKI